MRNHWKARNGTIATVVILKFTENIGYVEFYTYWKMSEISSGLNYLSWSENLSQQLGNINYNIWQLQLALIGAQCLYCAGEDYWNLEPEITSVLRFFEPNPTARLPLNV